MSNVSTATIDPLLVEFLEAMRKGGNEIDLAVITASDGTRTHTISIRPAAPLKPAQPAKLPAPVKAPAPAPVQPAEPRLSPQPVQTYCPDCGQCAPSRHRLTGAKPQRCKEHSRCFQCGATLTAAERFSCSSCKGINAAWGCIG